MYKFIITESDKEHIRSLYSINEQEQPIMDVYYALTGDLQDYYGEDNVDLLGTPAKIYIFGKPRVTWNGTDLFVDNKRIKVDDFKTKRFGIGIDSNDVVYPNPEYITNRISKEQSTINDNFKDGTTLRASQEFWDNIKVDEGLEGTNGKPALKAYTLGDGKVTIGWGHAEPIKTSTYRVGDTITKEEAQRLLQKDATKAADCVRRMLNEWKTKKTDEGKEIKGYMLTQSMFDVLVSLAFNAGCTGFRTSYFIKDYVKWGDYKGAADMLPTDKSMINGNFTKGLTGRRNKEAERFVKEL